MRNERNFRRLSRRQWFAVALAAALALLIAFGRYQICRLFAPLLFAGDQPAKADIIYVLGGDYGVRAPVAARLLHQGWARKIVLVREAENKALRHNQTDLLRNALDRLGVPKDRIEELKPPGGVKSTADEARALKRYATHSPMNRVLVVTSSFHGRRARMAMERALAHTGVEVRVITAESNFASREHWRETKLGRKQIELECEKTLFYFFTFFG